MRTAIAIGASRCLTGARTKIIGQSFLQEDSKGIKNLTFWDAIPITSIDFFILIIQIYFQIF